MCSIYLLDDMTSFKWADNLLYRPVCRGLVVWFLKLTLATHACFANCQMPEVFGAFSEVKILQ
jgi:hypothetical protein